MGGNALGSSAQHHASEMLKDNPLHIFLVSCLQMVLAFMTLVKKKPLMLLGILDRQQREDITQSAQV